MRYVNAAEILPERLLRELQTYIDGEVLYVPRQTSKKEWGTVSGSRSFYGERNREIRSFTERDIPWKPCPSSTAWPTVPSGKSYMHDQGTSAGGTGRRSFSAAPSGNPPRHSAGD